MSAISIQNLSKSYPPVLAQLRKAFRLSTKSTVEALKNVDLEIGEGEVFGLIGRNGAGKTTLTKIIATLVQPTSGTATVFGKDSVNDEVQVRSLIGLATAEERSFYWRLTITQNLLFFARLHGMKDAAAKARCSLLFEQLGLTEYSKRRFSDLSTGNKQKLAIARALLTEPRVILLDEPTRSLDPIAAASMREIIAELKGITILLTSHNLSEIEELCARVAVISKGTIKAVGTPTELRSTNQSSQRVRVTLEGVEHSDLLPFESLPQFELTQSGEKYELSFERELNDSLIGDTVANLKDRGALVTDIETSQSTLLEVLENYE